MDTNYKPMTKNASKLQSWFRKKRWSYDQYYKIYFTLFKNLSYEENYVCVIKSRSYEFSKNLLISKIKEDMPDFKVKNIRGYMFHKDYMFERSRVQSENKISIKDWEDIRNCAFPNQNDFLFKYKISEIGCVEILRRNKNKIENFHNH